MYFHPESTANLFLLICQKFRASITNILMLQVIGLAEVIDSTPPLGWRRGMGAVGCIGVYWYSRSRYTQGGMPKDDICSVTTRRWEHEGVGSGKGVCCSRGSLQCLIQSTSARGLWTSIIPLS